MNKLIVTITGPTCSGKSTLESKLTERYNLTRLISTTTRAPRHGEQEGNHYYFTTSKKFISNINKGNYVEWERFGSSFYGMSKSEINRVPDNGVGVVVVEPKGMRNYRNFCNRYGYKHLSVFIKVRPEDQAERFLRRVTDSLSDKDRGIMQYRLSMMLSEEVRWADNCHDEYSLVLDSFDEVSENTGLVAVKNDINDLINS